MKTTTKYFSTQKKKILVLLIFSNSQIFNNRQSEPSDVTRFPFSRCSIWRPKLTCLQHWARGNTKPPSQACVCLSTTPTRTWLWNISGQVRLISRPRQTDAQTRQLIYRIWFILHATHREHPAWICHNDSSVRNQEQIPRALHLLYFGLHPCVDV